MNALTSYLVVLLSLSGFVSSQTLEPTWTKLRPLVSSRQDVERILGKPVKPEINQYENEREIIVVWFSEGTCKQHKESIYNVPKGTVVALLVSLKQRTNLSELIDIRAEPYDRQPDRRLPKFVDYSNSDGSFRFQTVVLENGQEVVHFVATSPSDRDSALRCGT